jgi:hypothetical protein
MIQTCCPSCRLRFTGAVAYLLACPKCGEPPQQIHHLDDVVGFRLFTPHDRADSLPAAISVALPVPEPGRTHS